MGMMTVPMSLQEPDFMIHGVLKTEMFGQELWITTTTVGSWIITATLLLIAWIRQQEVKEGKCHGYAWHISVCAGDGDGSPAEHGRRHFRR